uniref:Uncharacterized protein n=1 Tax=Moniliophthora roreri TaxID=221103 RepID=A0A0W0FJF1_MONRR
MPNGTPEAKFYLSSTIKQEKADEREQSASLQKQQERWRQQLQQNPGEGAGALAHSDPSIVANAAVAPPKLNDGVVENVQEGEPPFRVPPATAIAGMLIRDWAERKIGFPPITPANL